MAAKGYMTDISSLRQQFDLTVGRNKDSTAWNLYRGHQETLSERRGIIYKQDEEDKKPIFTNVFSRSSGHPFICVTRMGDRL